MFFTLRLGRAAAAGQEALFNDPDTIVLSHRDAPVHLGFSLGHGRPGPAEDSEGKDSDSDSSGNTEGPRCL